MSRYEIKYVYCGYPKRMHMLYQDGKWIGTYATRAEAHKIMQECIEHEKTLRDWTLITA